MAGVDFVGCIAAVVTAFHSAADLVQALRERNDKKRRRREKDMEQAIEEKMLQKSLTDGAKQIQVASMDHSQRFGSAFEVGDMTAISELKDVVINLQTQIMSDLQRARSVETASLDYSTLHEASITNKSAAIRTMDNLCQRVVMDLPAARQLRDGRPPSPVHGLRRSHNTATVRYSRYTGESSGSRHTPEVSLPSAVSIPAQQRPPGRSQTHHDRSAQDPKLQRFYPKTSAQAFSRTARGREALVSFPQESFDEEDEFQESEPALSLHDSALGSDASARHRTTGSVTSTVPSDKPESLNSESGGERPDGPPRIRLRDLRIADRQQSIASSDDSTAVYLSGTSMPSQPSFQTMLHEDSDNDSVDAYRASSAPEVVTKEFESMMITHKARQQAAAMQVVPSPTRTIRTHPALRYSLDENVLDPEPDRIWSPLTRPAKHNDYHGFCKGAWNSRHSLQEGLAIAMIPNYKGVQVAHWKCKICEFRSRGMNNSKVLPDQVYFANTGIRYRWLFLAKSHIHANKAHTKPELYAYGCIFCAAQGRTTAKYDDLEKLMDHIVWKHKTAMMTPEVMTKTKCVVGGSPDRSEDWDVNIPSTVVRKISNDVRDFVVSAVTGIL